MNILKKILSTGVAVLVFATSCKDDSEDDSLLALLLLSQQAGVIYRIGFTATVKDGSDDPAEDITVVFPAVNNSLISDVQFLTNDTAKAGAANAGKFDAELVGTSTTYSVNGSLKDGDTEEATFTAVLEFIADDQATVSFSGITNGYKIEDIVVTLARREQIQTLSGNINTDLTLGANTVLAGTVFVHSGATLTVPAGANVFGTAGSSLFILKGARLVAEGTATNPIVFTSARAAGSRKPGDWGGIVLIGDAYTTRTAETEGPIPEAYGNFINPNNADSSGTLRYVRIEFAGNEVAPGDELNCLSMYGAGAGTTLEYVQCHMGFDDGFEWWGGSVQGRYLLATGNNDDDFDMDEGFSGRLQFLIGEKYPTRFGTTPSSDPHGFEMDGSHSNGVTPGGTLTVRNAATANGAGYTNPAVANFTVIGYGAGDQPGGSEGVRAREGLRGVFAHGLVYGFSTNLNCVVNGAGGDSTRSGFHHVLFDQAMALSFNADCSNEGGSAATFNALPVQQRAAGATSIATPNYRPTGTAAGAPGTNLFDVDARFNHSWFVNTNYYGAIQPGGSDWTQGWANFSHN